MARVAEHLSIAELEERFRTAKAARNRRSKTLIMGQFGSEQARRVIQGSGMSGAP